jgi:hypothetical protein
LGIQISDSRRTGFEGGKIFLLNQATMARPPDPQPSAEGIVRNFYQALGIYEESLPAGQKAVLYVSAGEGELLRIDRLRWSNPITIYCIQDAQSERMPAQVIVQHVSQFNVFMTYEEQIKEEKQPGTVLGFGRGV